MAGYDSAMTPSTSLRPTSRSMSQVNATPDAFGAGIGNAIDKTARGIQVDLEAQFRAQQQNDRRAAGTAYNRAMAEMGVVEDQYRSLEGDQADKALKDTIDAKNKIREKYVKDLTPDQVALFDEDYTTAGVRYDGRVHGHASTQRKALDIANAEGRLLLTAQEAGRSDGDPQALAQLHASQVSSLAAIAAQKGLPAGSDAEQGYITEKMGRYHKAVFQTIMAKGDLAGAQQYVAAYGAEMSPDDVADLHKQIKSNAEAEAPFALSDQFYNPDKTEFEQKAALREYAESRGLPDKITRAALSDLNSRYSDLDGARKLEKEKNYDFFLTQGNLLEASRLESEKWASLGQEQRDKLIARSATHQAPSSEQAPVMSGLNLQFLKSKTDFLAQFYKEEVVDGKVVKSRKYPPEIYDALDTGNLKQLNDWIVDANGEVSGENYSTSNPPPNATVASLVSNDFKKDKRSAAVIENAMRRFGETYKREFGAYPSDDKVMAFYDLQKSKVVDERGSTAIAATISGELKLKNPSELRGKYGARVEAEGISYLTSEMGLTRKEALAVLTTLLEDSDTAATLIPNWIERDTLNFQAELRAGMQARDAALKQGAADSATALGTLESGIKSAIGYR